MVHLRPFRTRDADAIVRYANDPRVSRYLSSRMPYPYTAKDAAWWLETGCRQGVNRAIDLGGECIGTIGVLPGTGDYRYSGELGYWLGHAHWGQGLGTRAVKAMTQLVFATTPLVWLYANVYGPNLASMRVLEKCGFAAEGTQRRAVFRDGQFFDQVVYARLRDSFLDVP